MANLKKGLFYTAYIFTATIFFLYYLFPTDAVKTYISANLLEIHPALNIAVDRITPAFPNGLQLQGINLFFTDDIFLNAEKIHMTPGLLSLLSPTIRFYFKGNAYAGTLEGQGEYSKNLPDRRIKIETELSGIQIKKISFIPGLTGRTISGILDGSIQYNRSKISAGNLSARISLSDCGITLPMPLLSLTNLSFSRIDADIVLNGRKLEVKKCSLKGIQMDGTLSGSVYLNRPVEKSVIDISGTIKPHSVLLGGLKKIPPTNNNLLNKNGFSVRLNGTLDHPGFVIN
ncbi:MAG: type II secretion system protein GspN [Proteobacteria bacterium]|nr:type II secretion system protein GspN [Pseudomonadota bacterium]